MNLQDFYRKYLNISSENEEELHAYCPFHGDDRRSFSVNKYSGLFHCFACGAEGNISQFISKLQNISIKDAQKIINEELDNDYIIPEELVRKYHRILLEHPIYLTCHRPVSLEVIQNLHLGWSKEEGRLIIPIYENSKCVNIRKHKFDANKYEMKTISFAKGFGGVRFYPLDHIIPNSPILLCEGEPDVILGRSYGYNCGSFTGGSGSYNGTYAKLFREKSVRICYDGDKAGRSGARKIAEFLVESKARDITLIELPEGMDLSDALMQYGKEWFDSQPKLPYKSENNGVCSVILEESSKKENFGKKLSINVQISGKDLSPFIIPDKIEVLCPADKDICKNCNIVNEPNKESLQWSDEEILEIVESPKKIVNGLIKKKLGIPNKCLYCNILRSKVNSIEKLFLIPEITFSNEANEYTTRIAYAKTHGVKTNRSYNITGKVMPHPKNQSATLFIDEATPIESSIDKFKMTPEIYKQLEIFQPKEGEFINSTWNKIISDLEHNVTKIYGRKDIIIASDLVFHSVLSFKFMNRVIQKGWTEAIIIGDTQCGKTETIRTLIQHYKAGELLTGEALTFAGMIGGIDKIQDNWTLKWGKIPLNNRRLVALDEVSGIPLSTIEILSGIRANGIAELIKIREGKTEARTRIIWLGNARNGEKLASHSYGIIALKGLMGKLEDIARLDLAVAVTQNEVTLDSIHKNRLIEVPHVYTSQLTNLLIMWAWSRKQNQIMFTKEAEDCIQKKAYGFSKMYSPDIPLVDSAQFEIKLAKLSVACACRLFSCDNTGENVIIKEEHVNFVANFIDQSYRKECMDYFNYSTNYRRIKELSTTKIYELIDEFKQIPDWNVYKNMLLDVGTFKRRDIFAESFDPEGVKALLKFLQKHHLVYLDSSGYHKTSALTKILKNMTGKDSNYEEKF